MVTHAQDWIVSHIQLPDELSGSLAAQMHKRSIAEELVKRQREEEEAEAAMEREARRAEELEEQIRADVERQLEQRSRGRALSDATEVPAIEDLIDTTPTETFPEEIHWCGVNFSTVRLYNPQKGTFLDRKVFFILSVSTESIGITWHAEPVADDAQISLQLDLLSIVFESRHYSTSHGRKKLKQLESELQRLSALRHNHLVTILAVKLVTPHSSGPPRLSILCEGRPRVTLDDVLEDTDCLREERASEYLSQILSALNAIHTLELVHRGLTSRCVGLVSGNRPGEPKRVKIFKVFFYVRLLDMHRSDPFGCTEGRPPIEDTLLPEGW